MALAWPSPQDYAACRVANLPLADIEERSDRDVSIFNNLANQKNRKCFEFQFCNLYNVLR